jgi:uncharacterized RDD family membrane protein YckC
MSAHVDPIPREARPFQGHRAGLITRTAAAAIDLGIVIIALGVCYLGLSAFLFLLDPRSFSAPAPSLAVVCTVGGLLLTVYLALSWMGNGRTYGNHVMGLRVVNHRGQRLHPVVSFVRAVLYVIFPIGLLWVLVSGHNRSLQDLIVRTSVTYDWYVRGMPHPPEPTRA